ncbi:MAG: hypothetical protein CMH52_08430, partial [Myxococcales bacterium]|nr:hypothetical protein [Myxococcales bacterium]
SRANQIRCTIIVLKDGYIWAKFHSAGTLHMSEEYVHSCREDLQQARLWRTGPGGRGQQLR